MHIFVLANAKIRGFNCGSQSEALNSTILFSSSEFKDMILSSLVRVHESVVSVALHIFEGWGTVWEIIGLGNFL